MVVALKHHHVLVADGVVAFLVVNIQERGYLREVVSHMLQQRLCAILVAWLVVVELYDYHPLSSVGVSYYYVPQQPLLASEVEELHSVFEGIVAYGVSYPVVQVVHEPAFLYRQNLVESSSDVESYSVHVVVLESRRHLFPCKPSFVAAAKLQLVSIFESFL